MAIKCLACAALLTSTLACSAPGFDLGLQSEIEKIYSSVKISYEGLVAGATEIEYRQLAFEKERDTLGQREAELLSLWSADYKDINYNIYKIRWDESLSDTEKVFRVAQVFADNVNQVNISYESNGQIFGWTQLADENVGRGIYYHDGLALDCSGFVQYIYYIATGKAVAKSTARQCEYSVETELVPGAVSYHYNSAVSSADEANHCAIWLGDNTYIDCAANEGGLRVKDITDNVFWSDFMTYHAILLPDDVYTILDNKNKLFY